MDAEWSARPGELVTEASDAESEFAARARECSGLAFRVAWSVVRERADAEEVAQEALLRAHRHFRRLREPQRLRAWLVRVAWRLALDRVRGAQRRARRECEAGRQAAAARHAESREFHLALANEIERLPRKLREALVLGAIEGYNLGEVARMLGVPEGTVKSRLFAARKRLAERLEWVAADTESS